MAGAKSSPRPLAPQSKNGPSRLASGGAAGTAYRNLLESPGALLRSLDGAAHHPKRSAASSFIFASMSFIILLMESFIICCIIDSCINVLRSCLSSAA